MAVTGRMRQSNRGGSSLVPCATACNRPTALCFDSALLAVKSRQRLAGRKLNSQEFGRRCLNSCEFSYVDNMAYAHFAGRLKISTGSILSAGSKPRMRE